MIVCNMIIEIFMFKINRLIQNFINGIYIIQINLIESLIMLMIIGKENENGLKNF